MLHPMSDITNEDRGIISSWPKLPIKWCLKRDWLVFMRDIPVFTTMNDIYRTYCAEKFALIRVHRSQYHKLIISYMEKNISFQLNVSVLILECPPPPYTLRRKGKASLLSLVISRSTSYISYYSLFLAGLKKILAFFHLPSQRSLLYSFVGYFCPSVVLSYFCLLLKR